MAALAEKKLVATSRITTDDTSQFALKSESPSWTNSVSVSFPLDDVRLIE